MMRSPYYLSTPMLFFSLIACASNGNGAHGSVPEFDEHFVTNITSDGTKFFSYSASISRPSGGGRPSGGRPDQAAMQSKIEEKLRQRLEQKISETGYCREGYIEINSYIGRGNSQIRGKCKEGATDRDRLTFNYSGPLF